MASSRPGLSVRRWWWHIYLPGLLAHQSLPRNRDLPGRSQQRAVPPDSQQHRWAHEELQADLAPKKKNIESNGVQLLSMERPAAVAEGCGIKEYRLTFRRAYCASSPASLSFQTESYENRADQHTLDVTS